MQTARGFYSSALGPDLMLTQERPRQAPSRRICKFIKANITQQKGGGLHTEGGKRERGTKPWENSQGEHLGSLIDMFYDRA